MWWVPADAGLPADLGDADHIQMRARAKNVPASVEDTTLKLNDLEPTLPDGRADIRSRIACSTLTSGRL